MKKLIYVYLLKYILQITCFIIIINKEFAIIHFQLNIYNS